MKNLLKIVLISIFLLSCNKDKQTTIILSKASKNYIAWIGSDDVNIIDAYTTKNIDSILLLADGIILTGGEDINPLMYNNTSNLKVCGKINFSRDTLEKRLFDFAFDNKIPLIGVCRGMQMMNVASGGTLYGDIPTEIGITVIHRNNGEVYHEIVLEDTSTLIFPLGEDTFMVNSWHHQGLKDISSGLRVIARSYDKLPEAVVMNKSNHPYMVAVQFHPERLGKENAIHNQMKNSFFQAISKQ
ncbi:MAG: gamma-glutamyl-gamma-aminobutyrate hydrolase family protein [Bacteroidota bacterium]|nr:gamma-glutamyl-gamma-aminobutyrate hydrolase family protein [Bacteroidota bacterium]